MIVYRKNKTIQSYQDEKKSEGAIDDDNLFLDVL